jgi:hypothetical protein
MDRFEQAPKRYLLTTILSIASVLGRLFLSFSLVSDFSENINHKYFELRYCSKTN